MEKLVVGKNWGHGENWGHSMCPGCVPRQFWAHSVHRHDVRDVDNWRRALPNYATIRYARRMSEGSLTSHRRNGGVTLIEVIIVLTIILALVTMLLPAINRSRESARRTKCAHNIRQIGINHAADSGTTLYTICPSDPEAEARIQRDGTSFVKNLAIRRKKKQMAYSKTVIFFEAAIGMDQSRVDPASWFNDPTKTRDETWQQLQTVMATKRHTGDVSNFLYADGHVVAIPETHIRTWIDRKVPFLLVNKAAYSAEQ
ncbi:type II secretion system protein [Planctomycetota bacterium]